MRKMKNLKMIRKRWLQVEEKEFEDTNDGVVDLG